MIGNNIKLIRKSLGITQRQLSERTGLSISYIQQLEYGTKDNPSLETLKLIADALNANIQDLAEEPSTESLTTCSQILELPEENYTFSNSTEEEVIDTLKTIIFSVSQKTTNSVLTDNQIYEIANNAYQYIDFLIYKLKNNS